MNRLKYVFIFSFSSFVFIILSVFVLVKDVAAGPGDFHQYFDGELGWGEPATSGSLSNLAGGSTSTGAFHVAFRSHNKTRVNPWTSYEAVSSGAYVELHHGVVGGENQCFWTYPGGYISGEVDVTCHYHHHH